MNNLEAKQKAIKNAYGECWEKVKDYVDENGWIYFGHSNGFRLDGKIPQEVDSYNGKFRPKSLQGIENNNGWIKIESEADLPKEGIHHSILLDSDCINGYRNYDVIVFYEVNSRYRKKEISHYQPIEKPKPPIY